MAKIMLVEDDNNLREIYGARLLAEGHEIVTAKDGEEALATAVKEKPDLIISDVMMPRISGFDMLDILRNAPETKFTKVIMMTALSQAEDKARADNLGADRYLVKSQVTLEDVAKVVKDVLEGNTDTTTPPAPQAEPAPVANTPPSEPAAAPTTPSAETAAPEAPMQSPAEAAASESSPEIVPVSEPAASQSTPAQSDDQSDTPAVAPASVATPIQIQAVDDTQSAGQASDPAAVAAQINVKLPGSTAEAPAPESEKDENEVPAPPVLDPANDFAESVESNIGPNLAEALQAEADVAAEDNPSPADTADNVVPAQTAQSPTPDTGNLVLPGAKPDAPTAAEQPVQSAPELPAEQPRTEESAPTSPAETTQNAEPTQPPNPLVDETRKKVVIQPIHDITKGPDLNSLLEKEKKNTDVISPPVPTVISPDSPETSTPAESTPAQTSSNQHDIISL